MHLNYVPACVDGMKGISVHEPNFWKLATSANTSTVIFLFTKKIKYIQNVKETFLFICIHIYIYLKTIV